MSNRVATRLFAALGALGLLTAAFLFGYNVGRTSPQESELRLLNEVEDYITQNAHKPRSERELIQGAIRGMLQSLEDPYAAYLDPDAYADFSEENSGQFSGGVGLWLKQENQQVKVVSVLPNTPAERAGAIAGDVILAVNGREISNLTLDEVVDRIQGKAGTTVKLRLLRGDDPKDIELQRQQIDVSPVESELLKGRVGLVELIWFPRGSGEKVRDAVKSLQKKGARGFILDLRGNPGGVLAEAVNVASAFLDGGLIVAYQERDKPKVTYEARGRPETKLPLVILVDEGSASSSEIVAAAIQDRQRGILVGTQTYGKGSIQSHFPLSDGSAVKLTIASYFTPSGKPIGENGIVPDIVVDDKATQLSRAQEILSGILAERPQRSS